MNTPNVIFSILPVHFWLAVWLLYITHFFKFITLCYCQVKMFLLHYWRPVTRAWRKPLSSSSCCDQLRLPCLCCVLAGRILHETLVCFVITVVMIMQCVVSVPSQLTQEWLTMKRNKFQVLIVYRTQLPCIMYAQNWNFLGNPFLYFVQSPTSKWILYTKI